LGETQQQNYVGQVKPDKKLIQKLNPTRNSNIRALQVFWWSKLHPTILKKEHHKNIIL